MSRSLDLLEGMGNMFRVGDRVRVSISECSTGWHPNAIQALHGKTGTILEARKAGMVKDPHTDLLEEGVYDIRFDSPIPVTWVSAPDIRTHWFVHSDLRLA